MTRSDITPAWCWRCSLLFLIVLGLAGCGLFPKHAERDRVAEDRPVGPRVVETLPAELEIDPELDPEQVFEGNEVYQGSGVFIDERATRRRPPPTDETGEITLNFEGQGIQEVVHALLGQLMQQNYVIAPQVSGEVTFATARPISRAQVMPVLEMLLRWNNATLIWREDRYHVLPISEAVRGHLVPRTGSPDLVRGYEVLAVPLRYIAPTKMQELLEPYAREDAILTADNNRALLFLAGTRYELRNYLQIIETFDVDWLEGMSIGMFSLTRVEVSEMLPELEAVFGADGESPLEGAFRFVPLERLNAVMVIATNDVYLEKAERWISRLDRSSPEAGSRLYVYKVKNLEADVLAGYLGDLFGTGTARQRQPRERTGGLAPGLEPARVSSSVGEFERTRQQPEGQQRQAAQGAVTLGDGDVRITAVMETNALLIQASPTQYDSIISAIRRLDEEPLQVLIEAQIIEVTLNEALRYGVSWFLANSPPGGENGISLPDGFSSSRDLDSARFGSTFGEDVTFLSTVTRRGVNRTFVTGIISALDSVSDTRTLSSPSLMVRNNAEARINVGQQLPVTSTSFTGGVGDRVFSSAQFIQTGVTLEVVPRVNPGGLVYMQVRQEISTPGPQIEGQVNRPINNREVSTEVAVQSGQTIVLGGLIREEGGSSSSGVPGLRRIPGIGALFGAQGRNRDRSETLVLITPTVVDSTERLDQVSREFQRKFQGLRPLRRPGDDLLETLDELPHDEN